MIQSFAPEGFDRRRVKDIVTLPRMESPVDLRSELGARSSKETPLLVISSAVLQSFDPEQGDPRHGSIRKLSLHPVSLNMIRTSSVPQLLTAAGTSRLMPTACRQRIPEASSSGSVLLAVEPEVPVRLKV